MHRTLLALAALCVFALSAHADTFTYSFTDPAFTFNLSTQTLITDHSSPLPTISCTIFNGPCSAVVIGVTGVPDFERAGNDASGFEAFDRNGMGIGGVAPAYPASFFTVGDHSYNGDTLDIVDVPSSVTPEPSTFALLGTGVLGIVGVARKRFA